MQISAFLIFEKALLFLEILKFKDVDGGILGQDFLCFDDIITHRKNAEKF